MRGLQRLQPVEPMAELVAQPVVGGVGDVFLGVLDLSSQIATSNSARGTAMSASTVSPRG